MKKIISTLLVIIICFSVFNVYANEENIEVLVDSDFLVFEDQPPVMVNDRVLVPLRAIFEALGARVYYDDATKLITAKRNLTTIELTVGSDKLYINGEETVIDVPAFVQNGRTLVPVRAVSEAFGVYVDWDEETPCVIINSLFWEHYHDIHSIKEEVNIDGKNVSIECYYPQLRGNKDYINEFNNKLKSDAEQYVKYSKNKASEYEDNNLKFERDFLVTYDFSDYFSYIVQDTVNGKDLNQKSFNYNIKSQNLIPLNTFKDDITDLNDALNYADIFRQEINDNPDVFFTDAEQKLVQTDDAINYYMTYKGFAYFVNPGIIAPVECGVITIEVEN